MKNIFQFVLPIFLLLCLPCYGMNVSTHIDNQIITTSTNFNFTLTADANLPDDALDIRPLFRNFIIGNIQITHPDPTTTEWHIPLQPVSDGAQTIPSLKIADAITTAIPIQVLATSDGTVNFTSEMNAGTDSTNLTSKPVHVIESSIDKDSFYPEEPVIFNVTVAKLVLANDQQPVVSSKPELMLTSIGKPEQDSSIFGEHYQETLTYHYYVIAKTPGSQTIPTAAIPSGREQKTDPINIQVKPIPPQVETSSWLPSAGISVEEYWEPQTSYAKSNQLLTRTLKIIGINNIPEQLPKIPLPKIKGVRVYLDTETSDLTYQNGMLVSTKIIKQVFVPQSNETFSTPAYGFHWWNTISDRAQYTELPARRFQNSTIINTTKKENSNATQPQDEKNDILAIFTKFISPTVILTFALAFIVFIFSISVWYIQRKRIAVWRQERFAWNEFKQICENGTPIAAYHSLLAWAGLKWNKQFTCLEQLPFYQFAYIELSHLQAACFDKMNDDWSGNRLVKTITAYKNPKELRKSSEKPEDSFHC